MDRSKHRVTIEESTQGIHIKENEKNNRNYRPMYIEIRYKTNHHSAIKKNFMKIRIGKTKILKTNKTKPVISLLIPLFEATRSQDKKTTRGRSIETELFIYSLLSVVAGVAEGESPVEGLRKAMKRA